MKRQKKKYKKPKKIDKERISKEKELMKEYGLRRKMEVWRGEFILGKFRRLAKSLIANPNESKQKELLAKLKRMGFLQDKAELKDVLKLQVKDILERRLQTLVFRKGLARTPKQARQLIIHGHVKLAGRKVVYPSYLVSKDEEGLISLG